MPRYVHPRIAMPEDVEAAIEVFGNRVRLAIIRWLAKNRTGTTKQIATDLDTQLNTVRRHLEALEAHGIVSADEAEGDRLGRQVQWTINGLRSSQVYRALGRYISGQ